MAETTEQNVAETTGKTPLDLWVEDADKELEDKPAETGEDSKPKEQVDAKPDETDAGEKPKDKDGEQEDVPLGVQKRIDKAIRKQKEAEEAAEAARQEAVALRQKLAEAAEPKQAFRPKPTLDQFNTHEEWVEAIADWKAEERDYKRQQEEAVKAKKEAIDAKRAKVLSIAEKGQETYADFVAVAEKAIMTEGMVDGLLACEHGHEVAYYLGNNRAEAAKISRLEPIQQAIAVARIDFKLSHDKAKAQAEVSTTRAPEPIKPLKGGGEPPTKDENKMSMEEWMKARDKGLL